MVCVFGVRAAESARRKAMWKIWQPHREKQGWILNPIVYWTDEDVWQFTRQEKIPYCCLYDEGKTRLGCIGCPMATASRKQDLERYPGYKRAWQRAITRYYDIYHNVPNNRGEPRWFDQPTSNVKCADDLWRWWMEELPEPEDDDCQMGLF